MARRRSKQSEYAGLIDTGLRAFAQLDRRARLLVLGVIVVAAIFAAVVYYQARHGRPVAPPISGSPHLLLGNPSRATNDPADRENYLMDKPYYALSYNDTTGTPNWVSWRVTQDDLGSAPRKQTFDSDMQLPPAFYRVTHKDYSGSGFDRGHLCPHSDRAANQEMSFATFVMSNIIPQAPNVNQKAWAQLEMYCRDLVRGKRRLYIMAGPAGRGGRGSKDYREFLANGRVTVPAECWKIIVVTPETGADDLLGITPSTRVIAVVMPNDDTAVGEEWAKFRVSVAEIEKRTLYRFFDRLSPEVAGALRTKVDDVHIPAPRPMQRSE